MQQEPLPHDFYLKDPVFQRLQWELQHAYENGWRDGGGDPVVSDWREPPVGWRLGWLNSSSRKFCVENGLIDPCLGWK